VARTAKRITNGLRIAEALSVGLLGRAYPRSRVRSILASEHKQSVRQRDLPMDVMVYYVIALGLFLPAAYEEVLRCLVEGLGWLDGVDPVRVAGKSAIAQARRRLGSAPLEALYVRCGPRAAPGGPGAYFGGLRLVSIDGSTLAIPDTPQNQSGFGRGASPRGSAAFPALRFVALVETGTHLIFAAQMGRYDEGELQLARRLLPRLDKSVLLLADRLFAAQSFLQEVAATKAQFLVRVAERIHLPVEQSLSDGSYLSHIGLTPKVRRSGAPALRVRVIEYQLQPANTIYRLITTLLDPASAPAAALASLYPQRWEHEGVYDEFKTHLRGANLVLRSKTPDLVRQEFYGLCLAHYAVRSLMLEAAEQDTLDPDALSFTHAVRVVRRKLATPPVFSPSASPQAPS
jgi:Insertion element 4 transposase N-terminal/Transposase DDE domain